MIFLKKLRLKDFKSYQDQTIEFMVGRNVIHGPNGAGKTSILLAILYALLGRVQRLGKMVPKKELVRGGVNSFTIELEFEIDGVEYFVKRTNFVENREAIAQLYRGEELIAEKQETVTNEIIELLGIDSITFENVVYIGQGEIPLIATERAGWRKNIFDQFLNLDVYEKMNTKFRDIETNNSTKIEILTARIHDLKKDTITLPTEEKSLLENQNRLKKRQGEALEYEEKFQNIQNQFEEEDKKRVKIGLLEESVKEKANQIKNIDSNISKKQSDIEKAIKQKISLNEPELNKLLKSHNQLKEACEKKQKELEKFIKNQEKYELELQSIEKRIEDNEITRKSSQDIIENNKKEIVEVLPNLRSLDEKKWRASVASEKDQSSKKFKELKAKQDSVRKLENEHTNLEAELRTKEKVIKKDNADLNKGKKEIGKIDSDWEANYKEYKAINFDEVLKTLEKEINERTDDLSALRNQNAVLNSQLNEKQNELKEIHSLKEGVKCPQCKQIVTSEHKMQIISEIQTKIGLMQTEIEKKETQIKAKETQLSEYKTKNQDLEKKSKSFQKLNLLVEHIKELDEQIKTDEEELQKLKINLESLVIEKPANQFDLEISNENENIQLYSNILTKIDADEDASHTLNGLIKKIEELNLQKEEVVKSYNPTDLNLAKIEKDKVDSNLKSEHTIIPTLSNILEKVNEKTALITTLETIHSELETNKAKFDLKQYQEIKKNKDLISQKIGEIKNDIETLQNEIIPNLIIKIETLKEKLQALAQKEIDFQKQKKLSNLIKILREFSREITPILRHQKTRLISEKATEIFLDLVGEAGEFDRITVTENYDLYVSRYGTDEDIIMLSGGEQVISCLAIRLAISEILAHQGLILLDEPTSHLDEMHVKDLVEVFELYSPARQIITVTHDNEFEKIADSLIQVYKENGISQIL